MRRALKRNGYNMKTYRWPTVTPDQYRNLLNAREQGEALRDRQLILMAHDAKVIDIPLAALRAFRDLIRADMLSELTDAETCLPSFLTNYIDWPTPTPMQDGATPALTTGASDTPPISGRATKKPSLLSTEAVSMAIFQAIKDSSPMVWPINLPE